MDPFFLPLPWRADVKGLAVYIDPDLHVRGEFVPWTHGGFYPPYIVLREYDQRVLVHEVLHFLLDGFFPHDEDGDAEEHQTIWAVTELVLDAPRMLGVGWQGQRDHQEDPCPPATTTTASSETTATPS